MIKNYIKVAFRNLLKNRSFSFINIFGLALSMSVCLVLIMLIADQKNNDHYNSKRDHIYRITHTRLNNSDFVNVFATTPLPLADKMLSDYADLNSAVRIRRGFGNDWIGVGQNVNIPIGGFFVDPGFIDLFEYELLSGDAETALKQPNSVVLKEKTAEKLYGAKDPMGEIITVGDLGDYLVTGIIKDNKEQSHIKFEALASLSSLERLEEQDSLLMASVNNWRNRHSGWVYVELNEAASVATVEEHLEQINQEMYAGDEDFQHRFKLQALTEISPGPLMGNDIGPGLPLIFVYFLTGLALVVMISASFNYMNLSIARALTRAREVGVRKVSGASRTQLILQFLTEAIVLALIALAVSHAILFLLKPAFSQLHFSQLLQWNLRQDEVVFLYSIVFSLLIGIVSGIVPALLLSSFQPIKVLKDLSGIKLLSKMGLRKFLIVGQFVLSLVFIITATLIFNQLKLMVGADFGFTTENIVNVKLNNTSFKQYKAELIKYPEIEYVTAASHIPAAGTMYGLDLKKNWEDEDGSEMAYFNVDEDYITMLNLELIAGKNFQQLDWGAHEVIINEKTVEAYDLGSADQAIDQFLIDEDDSTQYRIVGVISNYHHQMLIMEMSPMMLVYNPEQANIAHIAYYPEQKEAGIKRLEQAFVTVNPGLKIDYEPFSDQLIFYYDLLFGDIVKIIGLATALALVIACLGLLGIATYTVETKTKEVGIRKVLGATSWQLVMQLSKGFIGILGISIVIAVPLAYFMNNLWLQQFAFRVSITAGVIGFGVLTLLVLGVLTIGSQTLRAGSINPVDSLRSE